MELAKGKFALLVDVRATRPGNEQSARRALNHGRGQSESFRNVLAKRTKGKEKAPHLAEQRVPQELKALREQPVVRAKAERMEERKAGQGVEQQAEQSVEQAVESPAEQQVEQPAEQGAKQPVERLVEQGAEQSVAQQVELLAPELLVEQQVEEVDEFESRPAALSELADGRIEQISTVVEPAIDQVVSLATEQTDAAEQSPGDELIALLAALYGEIEQFVGADQTAQANAAGQLSNEGEGVVDRQFTQLNLDALTKSVSDLKQVVQQADLESAQAISQFENIALRSEQIIEQIKALTESGDSIALDDLRVVAEKIEFNAVKLALSDLITQFKAPDRRAASRSAESVSIEQVPETGEGFKTVETLGQSAAQDGQLNDDSDVKQNTKSVERRGEGVVFDISGKNPEQFVNAVDETLDRASLSAKATGVKYQSGLALRTEIFDQVKVAIVKSNTIVGSDDHSEMIIRLKPEELGKVELKIEVHNDNVIARFNVASQVVKEAIESNLQDLKNSLKDKGFSEMTFNVDVNQGGDEQSGFRQNRGRRRAIYIPTDVEKGEASYVKSLSAMINDASFEYLA